MARLIHLDGPSGVGKSTLARRYAEDHPQTLVLEIDVLRAMVSGWRDDFFAAGALIRPAALAMVQAYLRGGHDVVLPQLITSAQELARFRDAALAVPATYHGFVLTADPETVIDRFRSRAADHPDDPWVSRVTEVVESLGGDESIHRSCADLAALADAEALARLPSSDVETTYRALLDSLR